MKKEIKEIYKAEKVNMDGHLLDQPLPIEGLDNFDPFVLIHHWKNFQFGDQKASNLGVGPHPHRGFSPITFVYSGDVHHRDSMGNNAIVEAGGTQWMFAGRGITHSERPSKEMAEKGGMNEFIQFWVNAPAKNKMDAPYYKPISQEETPTIEKEGLTIQVICGEYDGVNGSTKYFMPLDLLRVQIQDKTTFSLKLREKNNSLIYLLDGALHVNGKMCVAKNMVLFETSGTEVEITAEMDTRFIVLSGEAINEPISKYGPYVMNTQTEIMEAMRDAQNWKMGILIEDFD